MAKEHVNYPIAEEKPEHYRYIKNFRTQQCRAFLDHRCDKSKPYTCFDYHYENQRRRVPKRDTKEGTFNYSASEFCMEYDPTKGICPKGNGCRFLHKTSGDTERLYHLRNYKTQMCQHSVDAKGHCSRNGPHCAFAHETTDLRPAVYDAAELRAIEQRKPAIGANSTAAPAASSASVAPAAANADTEWKSPAVVLAHFKTEPCASLMRACIGPTCPKYHNTRDRRRNPYSFSYRPQPCAEVKVADSWKEPSSCHKGDKCIYSHTRYEQQFHPEIYKSAFCVDHTAGRTCPRGDFCAFAHGDVERTSVDRVRSQVVPAAATAPTPLFPAAAAVLPPGATKQPLSVVAPPPGLPPIQPTGAPPSSIAQLLAVNKAIPSNGVQQPGQGFDVRATVATSGSPAAVGASSESSVPSARNKSDPSVLVQPNPIANFEPATTAGTTTGSTVGDKPMKPEELYRLIDADSTIDALEQKRRKKIVQNLAVGSGVVSFRLYNDTLLGTARRTDDYSGAGANSGASSVFKEASFPPFFPPSGFVSTHALKDLLARMALVNGSERPEQLMEDKVQRALLDGQIILNQTKLKMLSNADLRTIRKQLQQHVDMIDEIIEEKLPRQ